MEILLLLENLVGEVMKEIRGDETQLRFGFDFGVGRGSQFTVPSPYGKALPL